jgi:hypothetical protein
VSSGEVSSCCWGGSNNYSIEEDSIVCKAVSSLPIIGVIPYLLKELSLARQIKMAVNREMSGSSVEIKKVIRLIEVKNHYKVAAIIQVVLIIALLATLMGVGILHNTIPLSVGGASIAVLMSILAVHGYRIHHNREVKAELNSKGMRRKLEVK